MIGEQIQLNADGTLGITCKVPGEWLPLLNTICALKGTNINNLLKMCLQFLIETAKVTTEASPDMKVLLHMMKVDANWQSMFNYLTNANLDIAQVILVLQQRQDGKPREGFALAMFDKPFCGECQQTLSVDAIVERVIEIAMGKDDYWDLRKVAKHFDAESVREALIRMVDAQIILNLDEADKGELPTVSNLSEGGRAIAYGQRTRRKKHFTPDTMPTQTTIRFDDYDRELAESEVEDG
jgi:hypothetical protein